MADNIPEEKRRVYGRRLGRPLNPARQAALDSLLPKIGFPEDILESNDINPADYYGKKPKKIVFEVGFGDGDHLANMMKEQPQTAFIGAEPYINGMSAFLRQVQDEHLSQDHVRVWMNDAIQLMERFKENCLDEIYVLNPDPWPKARHHKRRIISKENLDVFAKLLKTGSHLIMTTDVDDLAEWMVTQASNHPAFAWTAKSRQDWSKPPEGWIETKYEAKGKKAGRKQTYLIFERL